jgi:uncharacterized protein YxjI
MRYAMSATWWPERFTICDDAGRARFDVRNNPGFATKLSLGPTGGEEIAAIRRRRGGRFQVIVRGGEAGLVQQPAADRYDIQRAPGPLAVTGDVAAGQYAITGGGAVKATVSRQLADDVRETQSIGVDIGDEKDTAVLLAMVLAIEAVRYERGEAHFNPRALLDLANPLNWLRVWPGS